MCMGGVLLSAFHSIAHVGGSLPSWRTRQRLYWTYGGSFSGCVVHAVHTPVAALAMWALNYFV